ncbi:MAG: alpha-1,2-fucosyltransferase [Lentisphaerae bacterium]|nr:alpha-1,2-fucosyltransferase [Lentisphaerota bacterium]
MVIATLTGGLGNQMFQYAAARAVAHRNGVALKLDVSAYAEDPKRSYALGYLNVPQVFASPEDIAQFTGLTKKIGARLFRVFPSLRPKCRSSVVLERHFHFDPAILRLHGNVLMSGNWQSEKYFQDIRSIIQKEFAVMTDLTPETSELAGFIGNTDSVSVHVRRGDYVSDPDTARTHGTCPPVYYLSAIDKLTQRVSQPHFVIFSDDLSWAKENLKIEYPTTYVSQNGPDKGHEDLRLMMLCRHHIIANSSFSWWAAWLSEHPEKIIIAPQKWFNDPSTNTSDLIPAEWIRI